MAYKPQPGTRICLLGATGRTGRNILQTLLTDTHRTHTLQLYVRSRSKLLSLLPSLPSYSRVEIHEGAITDSNLLKPALKNADTIICALGENKNVPGVTVMQDAAASTLPALQTLKQECPAEWRPPRLILLSSATWNPGFSAKRPRFLHWMICTAFARPYKDLLRAQEMYAAHPDLVRVCLVQPPAIVDRAGSGHALSSESVSWTVSYPDLAAGFVEIATAKQYREFVGAIGVSSAEAVRVRDVPGLAGRAIGGFLAYLPGYLAVEGWVWGLFGR